MTKLSNSHTRFTYNRNLQLKNIKFIANVLYYKMTLTDFAK